MILNEDCEVVVKPKEHDWTVVIRKTNPKDCSRFSFYYHELNDFLKTQLGCDDCGFIFGQCGYNRFFSISKNRLVKSPKSMVLYVYGRVEKRMAEKFCAFVKKCLFA